MVYKYTRAHYYRGFIVVCGQVKNNTSWYSYLCDIYCCCITGIYTLVYITQNNTGQKRHGFSADIEIAVVVV